MAKKPMRPLEPGEEHPWITQARRDLILFPAIALVALLVLSIVVGYASGWETLEHYLLVIIPVGITGSLFIYRKPLKKLLGWK